MSFERPLRGSCACHRNQYFIRAPQDTTEVAQVLFSTSTVHRKSSFLHPFLPQRRLTNPAQSTGVAQASPLSAHLRIPLTWYHAATIAQFPDETATQIRRVWEENSNGYARRGFCGFCGTPLTYWSEHPRAERDYIQVTMGSLCREDLGDLEDLGLIPETPSEEAGPTAGAPTTLELPSRSAAVAISTDVGGEEVALRPGRETTSIPWFDSIVEGSRLGGRLRTARGSRVSADGASRVEWEVVEYTDDGGGSETVSTPSSHNGAKRKMGDRDDVDEGRMES